MISDDCWLPDVVECEDFANWIPYQEKIYDLFKNDFVDSQPKFKGKPVQIRKNPLDDGKEQAFWHITTVDYHQGKDRVPDIRRCERIKWVRAFIENYDCNRPECLECAGMLVWSSDRRSSSNRGRSQRRVNIMLKDEKYVVILEPRDKYVLLITAYYLDRGHSYRKMLKDFERAKAESAAI